MSKLNKKKVSFTAKIRNYFLTGIVVLIPIGITLYLTKFLIGVSSKIIPTTINPNNYLPFSIPGLEILVSLIIITIIGGLSLSFLGKKILSLIDDLFKRIPFLRTVYSAIVQMTDTFTKKDDEKFATNLITWADIIRKTFYEGGVDEIISTRRLVHIVEAYTIFKNKMKAIEMCTNRFDVDTKTSFMDLYSKVDGGEDVSTWNSPVLEDEPDSDDSEEDNPSY